MPDNKLSFLKFDKFADNDFEKLNKTDALVLGVTSRRYYVNLKFIQ